MIIYIRRVALLSRFTSMSNVQRVAGALFTKIRNVDGRLDAVTLYMGAVDARLDAVTQYMSALDDRLDAVTRDVSTVIRLLDEQKKRNQMWFALVLGMNVGIFWCLLYMRMYGLYVAYVYRETVDDRSTVRIIADELFAWLFIRPWYE